MLGSNKSLTDKELLEALEKNQFQDPQEKHDVLEFLDKYSIQSGTDRINSYNLYKLYKKYSKEPLKSYQFYDIIQLKFNFTSRRQNCFINKKAVSQEILELLKCPKKPQNFSQIKHFQRFLDKYQLKQGKIWVALDVLYYIYDKWTYGITRKNPLAFRTFAALLTVYFDKKTLSNGLVGYSVNENILNYITKEEIEQVIEGKINAKKEKNTKEKHNKNKDSEDNSEAKK